MADSHSHSPLPSSQCSGSPPGRAAGRTRPPGPALYPDLQTAVPHKFTVQNNQQREYLRFANLIANTGAGDLRLHPESNITTGITTGWQDLLDAAGNVVSSQPVSEFVFHPAHNHWHITDVALFELRRRAGQRHGRQLRRGLREPVDQDDVLPDRLGQARGQLADG